MTQGYAPLFVASDLQGEQFELDQARRNGPVVLFFARYPGSAHTRTLGRELVKKLDRLRAMGARVVMLTEGSAEAAGRWSKTLPQTLIVIPVDGELYRMYNVGRDPLWIGTFRRDGRHLWNYASTLRAGHGRLGALDRLPAAFVVASDRRIVWSWQAKSIMELPDLDALCAAVAGLKSSIS